MGARAMNAAGHPRYRGEHVAGSIRFFAWQRNWCRLRLAAATKLYGAEFTGLENRLKEVGEHIRGEVHEDDRKQRMSATEELEQAVREIGQHVSRNRQIGFDEELCVAMRDCMSTAQDVELAIYDEMERVAMDVDPAPIAGGSAPG